MAHGTLYFLMILATASDVLSTLGITTNDQEGN